MEIQQFIQQHGDTAVVTILKNMPEIIQMYPKSAAYSTQRRDYVLTHVSEKKADEIYLRDLWQYAKSKNLSLPEISGWT